LSTRTADGQLELLQGTLDLLILQTVARGPVHGDAIAKSIESRSGEVLQVGHGSLYPALQRLIQQGLIQGEDGPSENNRQARFYRLSAKGRRRSSRQEQVHRLYTSTGSSADRMFIGVRPRCRKARRLSESCRLASRRPLWSTTSRQWNQLGSR
jgi:PadR family transcriptional regulator PadR